MNSRELNLIKIGLLILALICTASILFNIVAKENSKPAKHEPFKKFSVTISEDKWDESTMPKGRRSPSGVLYTPEGSSK
jgi:hypothetical protein